MPCKSDVSTATIKQLKVSQKNPFAVRTEWSQVSAILVFGVNFVKCQKELLSATQCWQLEKGRLNMVATGCNLVKQEKKSLPLLSVSGVSNSTEAVQHRGPGHRCPAAKMWLNHLVKNLPPFMFTFQSR